MATIKIDPYSACSLPISMFCNGHLLGSATGFMWRRNSEIFFVSNWHVFSGRHPASGQPRNRDGAIPDLIQILGTHSKDLTAVFQVSINLYDSAGAPLWFQSSKYGQKVDVAICNITQIIASIGQDVSILSDLLCLNDFDSLNDMHSGVGSEVFVLGFPLGLMKTGKFPVWKRASVATEYGFNVNNMPSFLIDTATREGMSGAPVIQRSINVIQYANGSTITTSGIFTKILGIYSGRYISELDEAQLGIVWRIELIEEIISDRALGDYILT